MAPVKHDAPGTEPATLGHLAPVLIFAYKRLTHLRRTIESLQINKLARQTELIVQCDGAKSQADAPAVAAVRDYVRSIGGFASVTIIEHGENRGLAATIISGVSQMLEHYDRVIVVEDDLYVSAHFLTYMNEALALYEHDERVASVHGYCYPVAAELPDTFFLRGADCWGWATWHRAWRDFRTNGASLLAELNARRLTRDFDLDGSYPFTRMLSDQVAGRNDSWAIRWHASCFLQDKLTLYPGRSLVENTGNDASGTHCGASSAYAQNVALEPVPVSRIPIQVSDEAQRVFADFLRGTRRGSDALRVLRRLWVQLGGRV
jgi:GNT-I family